MWRGSFPTRKGNTSRVFGSCVCVIIARRFKVLFAGTFRSAEKNVCARALAKFRNDGKE
jgi:hypothetical protein